MISLKTLIFVIIFGITASYCYSQNIQSINLKEIPQKKVRHYIRVRKFNLVENFSLIHPSWKKGTDKSSFQFNEKTFYLNDSLLNVWECYKQADPSKAWNGHFIRFGVMISKRSKSVAYFDNAIFPEIDTGQVYFLDLKLLWGLFNIPMAFEIINIDPVQKIMEFSYIDGNKSLGKQTIQFFDNGDGRIRITHQSYFKSSSALREHVLYPYFHKKFIKEFHRNMSQQVLAMESL